MNASRLVLALCLFATACGSEDSNGTGGAAGTGGAGGSGTGGVAGTAQTVSYIATIRGIQVPDPPYKDLGPMVGATVCLRGDATKCGTTDSAGKVTVTGIPAFSQIAMVVSHADYGNTLMLFLTTGSDKVQAFSLPNLEGTSKGFVVAGCPSPLPAGKGWFFIGLPAGAAASATGPTGPTKLIYFGTDGVFDPTLDAVPITNTEYGGAITCGVAPGVYQIDVTGAAGACSLGGGWPSSGHTLEILVDPDTYTPAHWNCQ